MKKFSLVQLPSMTLLKRCVSLAGLADFRMMNKMLTGKMQKKLRLRKVLRVTKKRRRKMTRKLKKKNLMKMSLLKS